jgi:hypothetical protein
VIEDADDFLLGAPERVAPSLRSTPRLSLPDWDSSDGDSDALGVTDLPRVGSVVSALLVLELGLVPGGNAPTVGVLSDDDASGEAEK